MQEIGIQKLKQTGSGNRNYKVLLLCALFYLFINQGFAQVTSTAAGGNWNAGTTWIGGIVPAAGQSVVISAGASVSVNINTPVVNNVTVNGTLTIPNLATATLSYSGNMIVSGSLINNGGIIQTTNGKIFQLTGVGSYTHNPMNVTLLDESIFTKSDENFASTSSITIVKWFDMSIGLGDPSRVQMDATGNFGNVTLAVNDTSTFWEQNGDFMDAGAGVKRVYGTLSVTAGTVSMDNGAGATTYLVFNDVIISGTGRIIFNSGPNRALNLVTNNFTDISTAVNKPTIIQDNCFGYTQWNISGNAILGHDFYGIIGTGTNFGGNLNVIITGSLQMSGGNIGFVVKANAPLTLTVNGNTTISGSPTTVRFIDGNTGDLNFTTTNFTISGGGSNILLGGNTLIPAYTGTPNFYVTNDFIINGTSYTNILDAGITTKKLRVRVGHDFNISGASANFTAAKSKGALTVSVGNNFNLTAGKFIGQIDTTNTDIDSVVVGNAFVMNTTDISDYFRINYGDGATVFKCTGPFSIINSGTGLSSGFIGIYRGKGNMTFSTTSSFTLNAGRFAGIYSNRDGARTGNCSFTVSTNMFMTGGFFRGIDNRAEKNAGTLTFYAGNLQYSGGNFSGYYSSNDNFGVTNFTVNGLCQITFTTAATDSFSFIGVYVVDGYTNTSLLNVSIAGNLNITGAAGSFISSIATERETISVLSEINISGGKNSFNSYPNSMLGNPHPVNITVGTNFNVSGGIMYLSAHNDSLVMTVNNNMNISLGELNIQHGYAPAIVNVLGGFTQTGGVFTFHKNSTAQSIADVKVTINSDNNATGDFSHTGGIINFDDNTTSVRNSLYIKSPNVTLGGNGSITMALPGTNTDIGVIYYSRTGTTQFNRTSTTHVIQQIEQRIEPGTTLVIASGNLQVSSLNVITNNMLFVSDGAVLDLQGNQIVSNNLQANSGMISAGRIRLTRTQGLYDGTTNAAISSLGLMVYRLQAPNSVVEYYGSDNQVITGIGVGTATVSSQKYYNLEINFNGTPGTEFVYPTNVPSTRSVFVRNKLILTKGELNLDDDHVSVGGGRSIIIERDSMQAITSTPLGYIRSEVYDSTASVIWKIGSRTGDHIIPFGYYSTSLALIPFTFHLPSGTADTVIVSTYHTIPTNLPYPPGVQHVHDLSGSDNSTYTVDRFWYLRVTGSAPFANLTFVVTPAEISGIASPRAQAWIPSSSGGWQYPVQGTQSNPVIGTYVLNANYYPNNWWTLAGLNNPLPISLLDFSGDCKDETVELKWSTATELNNDYFTVFRSNDGNEFHSIGTVAGAGNSNTNQYYSFIDREPSQTLAYYKIRQTDYDGRNAEYGPVLVKPCDEDPAFEVTVLQGIADHVDVLIRAPHDDRFDISLFSLDGKPLTSFDKEVVAGLNVVTLKTTNLASGLYLLRVASPEYAITKKIILGLSK